MKFVLLEYHVKKIRACHVFCDGVVVVVVIIIVVIIIVRKVFCTQTMN
jgi:hypothetical protein